MLRIFVLFTCLALAAIGADNKGKGKGKGNGNGHGAAPASVSTTVVFGTGDVRIIQQYYGAHRADLPPGLQKKLARGRPLPPGWQKKLQAFPPEVGGRLGPVCDYCERGVYGGYGVIFDKKTAVILDIVQLVADIVR